MMHFPRGSEWRKWDLHVHAPDTKLSNGYDRDQGGINWERFCDLIHDSDVFGIGITDYFTIDGFFTFKEYYQKKYPNCEKVFFPNLELRLNEAVNGQTEMVDFHIIFRPDLAHKQADQFLNALKTQITTAAGKKLSCADLKAENEFKQATVSREDIAAALNSTFGKESNWGDNVILITAVNNNGIRADIKSKRKANLSDQIDKMADAFFGSPNNTEYFLKVDRYEDPDQQSIPKPVFSGCDSHSFKDLESWLGKEILDKKNRKYVTWIKADLTYEGLRQTLIEPSERVRIQSSIPDEKEPYRVISRIVFQGEPDFPDEVIFNSGLNAIIGSRSTGKSALLAYISHAVNPEYTVNQQVAATGSKESEVGPGASISWDDVKDLEYRIEWAASAVTEGQVIYIPQNSLFAISDRPEDVTAKITPVIFRNNLKFKTKFKKVLIDIENKNEAIRSAIGEWFSLNSSIKKITNDIRNQGDAKAITQRRDQLAENIRVLRESSTLTEEEVQQYQQVAEAINKNEEELRNIDDERSDLSPYMNYRDDTHEYETTDQVKVVISIDPSPEKMPSQLQEKLQSMVDKTKTALLSDVELVLKNYQKELDKKHKQLTESNNKIQADNKELIEKNLANNQIASLLQTLNDQNAILSTIEKQTAKVTEKVNKQKELISTIKNDIQTRDKIFDLLASDFNKAKYSLDNMSFIMEAAFNSDDIERVSQGLNKNIASPFINNGSIDLIKIILGVDSFIEAMANGKQKLNRGQNALSLTNDILTITKEIRFVAEMEGDRIGGFRKSSMTPGKQALFALTLILADADEKWPLLIDQPEDDLDSRSICEVIVKDLMKRKRERQIIMVTHNANLAIGADSEEIIVANRHGDDRPNPEERMFSYLTGSLEFSKSRDDTAKYILDSAGIREHACEILDGGAEAFQKRKNKYRI